MWYGLNGGEMRLGGSTGKFCLPGFYLHEWGSSFGRWQQCPISPQYKHSPAAILLLFSSGVSEPFKFASGLNQCLLSHVPFPIVLVWLPFWKQNLSVLNQPAAIGPQATTFMNVIIHSNAHRNKWETLVSVVFESIEKSTAESFFSSKSPRPVSENPPHSSFPVKE